MIRGSAGAWALAAVLCAGTAAAQESGSVGVVTGYPASIGVVWRVSTCVAIRPEVSLSKMSGDTTSTGVALVTSSSAWTVGVGASALFYLADRDGLRPYISPRFSYGRNSSTTESPTSSAGAENWSDTYLIAASFGAEYSLGRRFAVFGELGLSYSRQTSAYRSTAANVIGSDSTANVVGTRSAVGVILFF
jgi:hypothetical protein